jgi:CheY-like chemotaxis protein
MGGAVADTTRKSVLIVEDNEIVATVLERVIGLTNMVLRVATATEAKAKIEVHPFDVVLCDLGLEDGDGLTVLRHARATQPQAIRLLMSGGDLPPIEPLVADTTIDAAVSKPFSGEQFEQFVARAKAARTG